jgi:hypothetical protein
VNCFGDAAQEETRAGVGSARVLLLLSAEFGAQARDDEDSVPDSSPRTDSGMNSSGLMPLLFQPRYDDVKVVVQVACQAGSTASAQRSNMMQQIDLRII